MITGDKIVIGYNKMVGNFLFHLIFWYAAFLFYVFLTDDSQLFIGHLNLLGISDIYFILLALSIVLSILFTFLDGMFTDRILRIFPRRLVIFIKSVIYFLSAFLLLLLAAEVPITLLNQKKYDEILNHLPHLDTRFIRFFVYFYLAGFLVNFLKGVRQKVGKRNFRSWVLGLLNKPMEQERIFMFIDLKSSTYYAEKLGHKKFSHLIQDIFNDLEVVDNYKGEIYQYLGDGAIISWSIRQGLYKNNFLQAFYAFQNLIHKRSGYYKRKYGTVPSFRAGAHSGKVMVLQVGHIRREISYNGDTVNTAARLESLCKEHRQEFMISENLYKILKSSDGYKFRELGNIKLQGKSRGIKVFGVKPLK